MGRRKLFTTFPRRLLDDDMFIRLPNESRHLLMHLYAYLHPHGRAPMDDLMMSRFFVPQLFGQWRVLMDDLIRCGFIETYAHCGDMFFCISDYDEDQPANLLRDRPDSPYPGLEDSDGSCVYVPVNTQEINCVETDKKRKEKKKRKKSKDTDYSQEFLEFYELYPRRDGRPAPWSSWCKAIDNGANPVDIMDGLQRALSSGVYNTLPKYIPMMTTWLNQERWTADYSAPVSEMESEDLDMLRRMSGGQ